jgi:endonuclease/exonuclease/phosphatase family metal-dependent hydrolase
MLVPRLLLIAASLGAAHGSSPRHDGDLRVMTFNVRLPLAADGAERWELRRDLMVETIRRQHPDIIGTQELYREQGDYIVHKLPQYAWFGIGRRGGDGDEHMGVFYRIDALRVVDSGNFWLSDTPDIPASISWGNPLPRMVTWARFARNDGRSFVLYDTHLPYRDQDEAARERCAALLLKRLDGLARDEPFVLTGDFNTTPDSRVHALLTEGLKDAWLTAPRRSGPDKTFHAYSGNPDRRIDWILFRGFRAIDARTVTTHRGALYPSDHFPVVADLAWSRRQDARSR